MSLLGSHSLSPLTQHLDSGVRPQCFDDDVKSGNDVFNAVEFSLVRLHQVVEVDDSSCNCSKGSSSSSIALVTQGTGLTELSLLAKGGRGMKSSRSLLRDLFLGDSIFG
jgi:hypothetical protein